MTWHLNDIQGTPQTPENELLQLISHHPDNIAVIQAKIKELREKNPNSLYLKSLENSFDTRTKINQQVS